MAKLLRIILQSVLAIGVLYSSVVNADVKIAAPADIVNSPTPNASAILDVESTTLGALIPRMTTQERDNIVDPEVGLLVYNTDTSCINSWNIYDLDGGATYKEWYDYCFAGRVVVDATISTPIVTGGGTGSIVKTPYDTPTINYLNSWDTTNYVFEAPFSGLYSVRASFGSDTCLSTEVRRRIAISKPDGYAHDINDLINPDVSYYRFGGDNNSIGAVRWYFARGASCSQITAIQEVEDVLPLVKGEHIFIQQRYQKGKYDVSSFGFKNDVVNRLLITYVGRLDAEYAPVPTP